MRTPINKAARRLALILVLPLALAACGGEKKAADDHGAGEAEHAEEEFERGPHNGRLLKDGDFALEVTIFEEGVEPQFRFYPYWKNKPIPPATVTVNTALTRLGGKVDRIGFNPQADYLLGAGVVRGPHSFDVAINASYRGAAHAWKYASYEGRTTIAADAAQIGGIKVEQAGSAIVGETLDLAGRVDVTPEGKSEVRAWYPGRIMAMTATLGQTVRKGQVIARVESSSSLQTYSIPAPINGFIVQKNANTGDVTYDQPLYVIADPSKLHAEFFLYPRDAERVRAGQMVEIRSLSGEGRATGRIEMISPTVDLTSQTQIAHADIPASLAASFRPGLAVEGKAQVSNQAFPLAVRTQALQRYRDFTVVFAKVGDTYEVRMLKLGRQTPEWTEVLSGLEPGETYVTEGAFLIRADVEKSGAGHDH